MAAMGSERARETVRRLQADVMAGRWPVNGRIPTEGALAAEFGVGRSTIREAVRSLAHLGMLEPAPGRGTFVRSLSPVGGVLSAVAAEHSWSDILTVRRGLEAQAAGLAARHTTPESVARLEEAHRADVEGTALVERGRTPGQFHALVIEMSGNALLAELYAGVMVAVREGVRRGSVVRGQDPTARRAEHAALIAAIAVGNEPAAIAVAQAHADHDLQA